MSSAHSTPIWPKADCVRSSLNLSSCILKPLATRSNHLTNFSYYRGVLAELHVCLELDWPLGNLPGRVRQFEIEVQGLDKRAERGKLRVFCARNIRKLITGRKTRENVN
jgi:hypothetical protein